MATVKSALTIRANNGASDNKLITPAGGDISLQLCRGFSCVINRYRVDIQQPDGQGGWQPVAEPPLAEGAIPSLGHPTEVLIRLDAPAALQGRRVILMVGGIALPPDVTGQVDIVTGIYQVNPDGKTYRRVDWEADSAHDVKELISRFEISIT